MGTTLAPRASLPHFFPDCFILLQRLFYSVVAVFFHIQLGLCPPPLLHEKGVMGGWGGGRGGGGGEEDPAPRGLRRWKSLDFFWGDGKSAAGKK